MNTPTTGTIRGFGSLSPDKLTALAADLGLSMNEKALAFCASHYRVRERRDPFPDELRMLDRLASLPVKAGNALVSELFSNDAFAAETYADMMQKRHELRPDAQTPPSLAELFGLANEALARAGKHSSLPGVSPCLTLPNPDPDTEFYGAAGSALALDLNAPVFPSPAFGDIFLLLRRGNMRMKQYRERSERFLNSSAIRPSLRALRTVGADGLLPLLLSFGSGLRVDLCALGETGADGSPELLVGCHEDYRVLLVERNQANAVATAAEAEGFSVAQFASLAEGMVAVFLAGCTIAFRLEIPFLRALMPHPSVSVRLSDETDEPTGIRTSATGGNACRYLTVPANGTIRRNGAPAVFPVFCAPERSVFRSVLEALLCPLLSSAASGGDYAGARLAVGLKIPVCQTPEDFGMALSAILAVYRFQTELGIPAATLSLMEDDGLRHPELTAFVLSPDAEPNGLFRQDGDRVCLLAPAREKNGLPDFPLLRSLLSSLSSAARNGIVRSASILCGESVTSALGKMRTNEAFCRISDVTVASQGALPLAVLLERAPEAEFPSVEIGTVEARGEEPQTERFTLLPTVSRVWRERDEITVLYRGDDADARTLCSLLSRDGTEVRGFVADDLDAAGPFSRSLITSQLLIVCDGAALFEGDTTQFALETLWKSGGNILSFGDSDPLPVTVPHTYRKDGIPSDFRKKG